MDILHRAKAAHGRTKDLLQHYHGSVISAESLRELLNNAEQLDCLIDAVEQGKPVTSVEFVQSVARGTETTELLCQAVITLENRLCALEDILCKFKADHDFLLLRQIGYQVQNKIARLVLPGQLTASDVRHETLQRLKRMKNKDEQRLTAYLAKYDIENGIEALNTLGVPVAHPHLHRLGDGEEQSVTEATLRHLVQQHFSGSTALQSVQQVLECLVQLTTELGPEEPLFAPTTQPQQR